MSDTLINFVCSSVGFALKGIELLRIEIRFPQMLYEIGGGVFVKIPHINSNLLGLAVGQATKDSHI